MRGGPNRGQGRKPLPPDQRRQPVQLRLPPDLLRWIDAQEATRTEIVERAVRALMDSR